MSDSISLPKVPANAWRVLRARAASAPSTKFTASSVAAMLSMSSPKSAGDNVVYPMRRLGLLDEDGNLTPRGNKWRVDGTYEEACDEILAEVYPDELAGLTDNNGQPDRSAVVTWLHHKGLGESNAKQMASTYVLIASRVPPDPAAANAPSKGSGNSSRKNSGSARSKKQDDVTSDVARQEQAAANGSADIKQLPHAPSNNEQVKHGTGPQIHLDIQIHIPGTADAEQIDAIFASMAKHLYP
ncbi:hypothetical protein AB6V29_00460 [Microbacterium sp. 20-116]|uniref:hypothetical protein n=1 Tax=Microbacterium sp. 20-116 TaxID=3239883 RepID=UPI0034E2A639